MNTERIFDGFIGGLVLSVGVAMLTLPGEAGALFLSALFIAIGSVLVFCNY